MHVVGKVTHSQAWLQLAATTNVEAGLSIPGGYEAAAKVATATIVRTGGSKKREGEGHQRA